MEISINIILIILRVFDIILHSVGIYYVLSCKRRRNCTVQHIYIINLSVTEICFSLFWILVIPISNLFTISNNISAIIEDVQHYIMICIYTSVAFVFYATMVFITLDRLLAVKFPLRYRIYCSAKFAKYLIFATWVIGLILCLTIIVVNVVTGYDFNSSFHTYLYTPINFIILILATLTYTFIFLQYKRSLGVNIRSPQGNGTFVVFYKSRFYLPVLLILTFLLFITIPHLTYVFAISIPNKKSGKLLSACVISYSLSNIIDGCLYIFLQPNIANQLRKTFRVRKTGGYQFRKGEYPRNVIITRGDVAGSYDTIHSGIYCIAYTNGVNNSLNAAGS